MVTVLVSVNWSTVLVTVTFKREITIKVEGIFLLYFTCYQHLQKAFCSISVVLTNYCRGGEDKWYFSAVNYEFRVKSL